MTPRYQSDNVFIPFCIIYLVLSFQFFTLLLLSHYTVLLCVVHLNNVPVNHDYVEKEMFDATSNLYLVSKTKTLPLLW